MTRARKFWIGGAAVAVLAAASNAVFWVDERQQAVLLHLGKPTAVINAGGPLGPGLRVKLPLLDEVVLLDKRLVARAPGPTELTAADGAKLQVDAVVRYRIDDPLLYRALGTGADARIDAAAAASLKQVLGAASWQDLIATRRAALAAQVLQDVQARALQGRLGIRVADVVLRRVDAASAQQAAVFNRMRGEREQDSARIRAEGAQRKAEIVAAADKDAAAILAEADRQAQVIRGEGDARRAAVLAASFGQDPAFAGFYRAMQAYEVSLARPDTTLVLAPDSPFLRYLKPTAGAR